MNCFPCFSSQKRKKTPCQKEHEFDAHEAKAPGMILFSLICIWVPILKNFLISMQEIEMKNPRVFLLEHSIFVS